MNQGGKDSIIVSIRNEEVDVWMNLDNRFGTYGYFFQSLLLCWTSSYFYMDDNRIANRTGILIKKNRKDKGMRIENHIYVYNNYSIYNI